ncbi:hypothetical protein PSYMO_35986, partial [Pseudomonas amygdali pv. mori str. 301020]
RWSVRNAISTIVLSFILNYRATLRVQSWGRGAAQTCDATAFLRWSVRND